MEGKHDAGLTLIELVISMALFALVAVMGLQILNGTLRNEARLSAAAQDITKLADALALLRADLRSMAPIPFFPPDGPRISSLEIGAQSNEIAFSTAGQRNLIDVDTPAFHRIEWRLDRGSGSLTRLVWPTLSPVSASQSSPEVAVLNDVESMAFRTFVKGQGWQVSEPGGPNATSSRLPLAIEVTLTLRGTGSVILVEALR